MTQIVDMGCVGRIYFDPIYLIILLLSAWQRKKQDNSSYDIDLVGPKYLVVYSTRKGHIS